MKNILFLLLAISLTSFSFAQNSEVKDHSSVWPEMKAFHEVMAATFHPAEKGDLGPLKSKAAELYKAAKLWDGSTIPDDYNKKETAATLHQLLVKCNEIWSATTSEKSSDKKLMAMIDEAHEIFHKIMGVCKKKAE